MNFMAQSETSKKINEIIEINKNELESRGHNWIPANVCKLFSVRDYSKI